MNDRNSMFYGIVDLLPVHDSVNLFRQEDDDILITFFGGITEFANELDSDVWYQLMLCGAGHIHKVYNNYSYVLVKIQY